MSVKRNDNNQDIFSVINNLNEHIHSENELSLVDNMLTTLSDLAYKGKGMGIDGLESTRGFAKLITAFSGAGMTEGAIAPALESLMGALPRLGEKFKHGKGWKTAEAAEIMKNYKLGDITGQLFDGEGNLVGKDGEAKLDNVINLFHTINRSVTKTQDKLILFKELLGDSVVDAAPNMDWGQLNAANEKMRDQLGLSAKLIESQKTLGAHWENLKIKSLEFLVAVGTPLLPLLTTAADKMGRLVTRVTAWTEKHPKLTKALLLTVAATGGLLFVGGSVITMLGVFGKAFIGGISLITKIGPLLAKLAGPILGLFKGGMLAATKSVLGFTGALLTNPVGWIALAIAGAAYLIYKNWDPIKNFFAGLWNWFKGQGPEIDFIVGMLMPLVGVPLLIAKHWDEVKEAHRGFVASFKEQSGLLDEEVEKTKGMFTDLCDSLADLVVPDIFKSLFELFGLSSSNKGSLGEPFRLGELAAIGFNMTLGALNKALQGVLMSIQTVVAAVKNLFTILKAPVEVPAMAVGSYLGARDSGKGVLASVWDGFKGMYSGTKDNVTKPWEGIGDKWGEVLSVDIDPVAGMKLLQILDGAKHPQRALVASDKSNNTENPGVPAPLYDLSQGRFARQGNLERQLPMAQPQLATKYGVDIDPVAGMKLLRVLDGAKRPGDKSNDTENPGVSAPRQLPTTSAPRLQPREAATKPEGSLRPGNVTTIHYSPKFEFKGDVKEEDKNWFRKQLDAHKDEIAKIVADAAASQAAWAG